MLSLENVAILMSQPSLVNAFHGQNKFVRKNLIKCFENSHKWSNRQPQKISMHVSIKISIKLTDSELKSLTDKSTRRKSSDEIKTL